MYSNFKHSRILVSTSILFVFILICIIFKNFYMNLKSSKKNISDSDVEILKLEFEYAKSTSLQAQSDRLSLVNFFVGIFGAISSISIALINSESDYSRYFSLGFFLLSFIGYIFIIKIIRLRQAWIESARAMNSIKGFFISKSNELDEVFIWKTNSIPKAQKFKTISYLSAFLINILSTASLLLGLLFSGVNLVVGVILCVIFFLICISTYYFFLKYNK